jgi:two-component system chemotaxis response regulator CheY
LGKDPSNTEDINKIFRAFHSLKGNARMLGFDRLGLLAHTAEDVLSLIRKGELKIDKAIVDSLLGSMDMMHLILGDIRSGSGDDRDTTAAIASLEAAGSSAMVEKSTPVPAVQVSAPAEKPTAAKPYLLDTDVGDNIAGGGIFMDLGQEPPTEAAPPKVAPLKPFLEPVRIANPKKKRLQEKSLKILIAEDDFTARTILMRFLSEYGDCDIAKDGLEAIQAFTHAYETDPPHPYDLVCMDIIMPNIDGTVAAKTLREIERSKGVEGTEYESAIVFTSAANDPATIVRACYECGANHYFVKPLSFKQMERQMRKLNLIT